MAGGKKVRNFWSTAHVDDRMTAAEFGPSKPDGGFTQTIRIRHNGEELKALKIVGKKLVDGTIVLEAYAHAEARDHVEYIRDGEVIRVRITTER